MFGEAKQWLTRFAVPNVVSGDAAEARPRLALRGKWWYRAGLGGALLLLVTLGLLVALLHYNGLYPGLRTSGADLSWSDRTTAEAKIAATADRWDATIVTLRGPQGATAFTRAELGLHYDRDAALAAAFAAGRDRDPLTRLQAIWHNWRAGRTVDSNYWVDGVTLHNRLLELASQTDIMPRDGALRIEGGQVIVVPAVEGRGLDVEVATAQLLAGVSVTGPVELQLPVAERIQPRIDAPVLAAARQQAESYLATPVQLRGADLDLTFDRATIGSWLVVQSGGEPAPLQVSLDPARVRATIAPLAASVRRDPRNAAYEFDRPTRALVVTEWDVAGRRLLVDQTTSAVVAALSGAGNRLVAPVTESWPARLTAADVAIANRQALRTYLAGPLVLTWGGERWLLTTADLATWLSIEPGSGAGASPRLVFDDDALSSYLLSIKGTIDRAAIDATYTMDDGADFFRLTGPSRTGLRLDGPAAFRAAMVALQTPAAGRVIALPVATIRPQVTEADVAALVPERWIDVDLTHQRLSAVVGKKVIYTATISSGKKGWETPTGTFYINYRVENETMTSESIGAEEYYRLENVLYTQYFSNEGHALHYSWWKAPGSFGTPSSHGCVSETLADAKFFWDFATIGTRVYIHGRTPV